MLNITFRPSNERKALMISMATEKTACNIHLRYDITTSKAPDQAIIELRESKILPP